VLPDGAEHLLSVSEDCVVEEIVEKGGTDDCEVEDLMARSAEVERSRLAPLWAPDHVNNCALDVDVASESVAPGPVRRNVLPHKGEHDEHHSCGQA